MHAMKPGNGLPAAAATGEGERRQRRSRPGRPRRRAHLDAVAVEAEGVDQHLALRSSVAPRYGGRLPCRCRRKSPAAPSWLRPCCRRAEAPPRRRRRWRCRRWRDAAERAREQRQSVVQSWTQNRRSLERSRKSSSSLAQQVVDQPVDRRRAPRNLVARHAAAGVERNPEADRHPIGAELGDRLVHAVFVDEEVVLVQARKRSARRRRDRGRKVNQFDAALESRTWLSRRRGRRRLLCRQGADGRHDNRGEEEGAADHRMPMVTRSKRTAGPQSHEFRVFLPMPRAACHLREPRLSRRGDIGPSAPGESRPTTNGRRPTSNDQRPTTND